MELSTEFGVEVGLVVLAPNGGGMLEYATRGMEALLPRFHRFGASLETSARRKSTPTQIGRYCRAVVAVPAAVQPQAAAAVRRSGGATIWLI